jgi:NADPH:quinone reductase
MSHADPIEATRIIITRPGGPEVLREERITLAPPRPGEALIEHAAIGLNFIDTHHRNGRYRLPSYPSPIGVEASGTVVAIGPGVEVVRPGDRVAYSSMQVGAYADRRAVPVDRLIPVPDRIPLDVAAAALNKGLTAHYLCHSTHAVVSGETILVHAAAGGVGSILAQWANHIGARVIGTVGSAAKRDFARAQGCADVVVTAEADWPDQVRALTDGRGVPVAYDAIGPATFEGTLRCMAPRGLVVSYGTASGPLPPLDLFRLNALGSLYVTSPGFATYTAERTELLARGEALFAAMATGILSVPIGHRYRLTEAEQAHTDLQERRTIGASVLLP